MEKIYLPSTVENKWYSVWESQGLFIAHDHSTKPRYSIVIPPPNVTGILHMGHALNNTIQDILIRWKRMSGFETLWMPGTDHAGIATQAVVEKRLFEQEKKTRHELGREGLLQRIWAWKEEYEVRITGQLKKLGCSCDWMRQRFTLDEVCGRAVRHAFFRLFQKGLIYRGKRLVNWDTMLQTAVADDEIFYETVKGNLWYFRYPLADGGFLPVATTRPETILGDTAVAVHPDDPRYHDYIGKKAIVPFVNRHIPIIADGVLVDATFGTGCVKVTPAHDPNDYQAALRNGLEMINILTEDGCINENGGPFAGQNRFVCRENIVRRLQEAGLMERVEPYETQVGHSDRSKTTIEPMLSDQWFVKMEDLAERAMEAVRSGRVRFVPSRYADSYLSWLEEKRDWCISRQLWWGHQIPIWYCDTCSEEDLRRSFGTRDDVLWRRSNDGRWLVCFREGEPATNALGEEHRLTRDPDVLDTWFSSALWPHSTMGWPDQTDTLKAFYPTNVLVTNRDIITLWVARMVIASQENLGVEPFSYVYIHATILDGNGQRMSKSKGNGVDPLDIIEKYGADALRFTMASLCSDHQDARLPVKAETLPNGRVINTSEKFEIGRNFANKLWNAARFLIVNIKEPLQIRVPPQASHLGPEDRWILSRLNQTIANFIQALEGFRFSEAAHLLYDFTWHDFCDWYLEIKKADIYAKDSRCGKAQTALAVCSHVLATTLKLLHPIMPFITEEIWSHLRSRVTYEAVIDAELLGGSSFPICDNSCIDLSLEVKFLLLQEVVTALRTIRAENNVPPTRKGEAIVIPACAADESWLASQSATLMRLAGLSNVTVDTKATKPPLAGQAMVRTTQVYFSLAGLIDVAVERTRLQKESARIRHLLQAVDERLANPNFVQRAPAEVIAREREKRDGLALSLEKIEKNLASLVEAEHPGGTAL